MDNDQYGHVNNAAYYSFFDTAINGWLIETVGSDVKVLDALGIVAETSCRFLSEVKFPDLLYVGMRLEKLGKSSVIYELGLFANDADEPSAIGRFVHVYVDPITRKPSAIPAPIRDALAQLQR
jgi:acyl-CoA thioester hydrolase